MQGCFIGHRVVENKEKTILLLKEAVIALIKQGVTTFLFGEIGEFDRLAWKVVSEVKEEFPFLKRVYVRAAYPYINKDYEKYLHEFYEETYFPAKIKKAGKNAYVARNYEMVDNSTHCVFYYNERYAPPQKNAEQGKEGFRAKGRGGTKIAYEYAIKRKKNIINIFNG